MKMKKFFDRPILSSLIMEICALSMLVIALPLNAILNAVLGPSNEIVAGTGFDVYFVAALTIGKALSGILILLFVKISIDKEYRFFCRKENFLKGIGFLWLLAVVAVLNLMSEGTLYKSPLIILGILFTLSTGFVEEAFFRGAIIPNVLRVWKDKKNKYLMAALISSAPFGIFHLVNIPQNGVVLTLFQVFFAAGVGMLFAAAYLRSGNLMSCVIIHTLVDLSMGIFVYDAEVLAERTASDNAPTAVFGILAIIAALYLIRPAKHGEIEKNFEVIGCGSTPKKTF